jgi:excisionase family DNA binding protein
MLLNVKQVAELLRVERSCIYWLLGEKRLHGIRIGFGRGTIRIESEEVLRYVRDNTVRRRGKLPGKPRISAPNAFMHLNASRLREAWAEQGVVQPTRQHSTCDPSAQQDVDKP